MPHPRDIAVFFDSPDDEFFSMQIVGDRLVTEWATTLAAQVRAEPFTVRLPKLARKLPSVGEGHAAFNVDRVLGRFLVYPPLAALQRGRFDFYHVVDHSYAHLALALPRGRTGVFCHDLDAFKSLLREPTEERPAWFRAMQGLILAGLKSAAVVFHTTNVVRSQIEREGIVPSARLVQAPYGIAPEFDARPRDDDGAAPLLAPLGGQPFLLHVGSSSPRKRLDVLFETFARVHARHPELRFVQVGAQLGPAHKEHLARLGLEGVLLHHERLEHRLIAGLLRRARAVLLPSEAEGFGIPLVEALACGAVVFASDIPVLREVGRGGAIYCPLAEPDAWSESIHRFLTGELHAPPRDERIACTAAYTWENHARTIFRAYEALDRN
ncbi:MAG TPA: glycosyltransferase [Polyangiaceae bacterium]|jgi:glycosyltransferase involved in cell wall biosynthesis